MSQSDTQPALLMCGDDHGLRLFDAPKDATRYRVPARDDVPTSLHGVEFEYTGRDDGIFRLPLFRRCKGQAGADATKP